MMEFFELSHMVSEVISKYNNTPHSTINYKTPNQVHYNKPSNSREYVYAAVDKITEEVGMAAQKGHEKFLKSLHQMRLTKKFWCQHL